MVRLFQGLNGTDLDSILLFFFFFNTASFDFAIGIGPLSQTKIETLASLSQSLSELCLSLTLITSLISASLPCRRQPPHP